MFLSQLEIQHVRNLTLEHLECGPGINLVFGANAAGKSAVLEAIHLLSTARSFRTPRIREVIQHGQKTLAINATLIDRYRNTINAGIVKGRQRTQIRFKGNRVGRRSEQIRNIPVISIVPETLQYLTSTPKTRRHWLDWALFHVEPRYFDHWLAYHQALRQRNSLLRQGKLGNELLQPWESAMADNAVRMRLPRQQYLHALQNRLRDIAEEDFKRIELQLKTPDKGDGDLKEELRRQRQADARLGHTRSGPHCADVMITFDDYPVAQTLSRGEGKRLMILLMLAQAAEYQATQNQAPIIIIDDLAAELDPAALESVLGLLSGRGMQVFITTISAGQIVDLLPEYTAFHVEHGRLQKMVN